MVEFYKSKWHLHKIIYRLNLTSKNTSAHHNLACLYHVESNIVLAEQHFKQALNIKPLASTYCDYGFFLLRQKRYEEAIKNFITSISLSNDSSGLMYGKIEKNLLDKYLQQEITDEKNLRITPFFIAHYWVIQCFLLLKDNELKEFYLVKLVEISEKFPSALHYRILSYAYRILRNNEKADEYVALSISLEDIKVEQQLQRLNFNQLYLGELSALVEKSPTALRYLILSYVYFTIGNEEKAQDYMALALSLEPTDKLIPNVNIPQNSAEHPKGYNPTFFTKSETGVLAAKALIEKQTILQPILQKAEISITTNQDKELAQIIFTDHKLVQQFAEELYKIGISNLNINGEPRKSNVIVGKDGKEDEYIILLTANEYNSIMDDKDAYAKLINSQHQQPSIRP